MAIDIADLTLDEVVQHLAAGNVLHVSGGDNFELPLDDSRTLLAFYNQNRQAYWNPDKDTNILDGEVDRLLDALDKPIKVIAPATRPTSQQRRWQLIAITAHRFRGLHRHCDEKGADPRPFTLSLSRHATLFRGFNGAGKTSLISAICWCLTGYGHRSQGLFDETTPSKSQDEAIETYHSPILEHVVAAASVVGDSAFPVALNGGHVLLGDAPNLALLQGRILAVVTKADEFSAEHFSYLKRLWHAP